MRARSALAFAAMFIAPAGLLPSVLGSPPEKRDCRPNLRQLGAPGCEVLAKDTGTGPATISWGRIECEHPTRQRRINGGGDGRRTAEGARQANNSFRSLSVRDGDDFYGERCELGRNNHRPSRPTFALAGEGDRRAFFFSVRLPERFPLRGSAWQSIVQLKQTQPAANGGGSPMLAIEAAEGAFSLRTEGESLWKTPAPRNRWVRFALDVAFSQNPQKGWVRAFVDLDGDGDARGRGERSGRIRLATLKSETEGGGSDGIDPGESIPAHLRIGIYHDSSYRCAPPRGCVVHFDNVQAVDLGDAR